MGFNPNKIINVSAVARALVKPTPEQVNEINYAELNWKKLIDNDTKGKSLEHPNL